MNEASDIIKSGAADKIADLVNKLAGPLAEEVGLMLGDKVRVYRVQNWVKTAQKTQRILRQARLSPNAVPPRLFLPIMEACSVEDNETLQDMWAALLATASQRTDDISPSFVETLKQLTPGEAKYLKELHDEALENRKWRNTIANVSIYYNFSPNSDNPKTIAFETYERLGLIKREYDLRNIPSLQEIAEEVADPRYTSNRDPEIAYQFVFTEYAAKFMQVCQGPSANNADLWTGTSKSD